MMIISNMRPLECNSFLLIWPGHLAFDPMWPSFKLDLKNIKTNILSKIHDDCFKNVTGRVLTRFSADLARWPCFWPQVTQFQTWPRNHQDKHVEQDSCTRVLTRFSADLARWPSFWPQVTQFRTWPKYHQDKHFEQDSCLKNVTARVLTKFSADLARWPSFWLQVTQFQPWPRTHQDKHFEPDSWWLLEKCDR